MVFKIAILLFGLFLIAFCFFYWREWQYRKKPYYKKLVRKWKLNSPPAHKPIFSAALIGDTGNIAVDGSDPVLFLLRNWLLNAPENCRAIFLGDNIYPKGIPPATDHRREMAELKIKTQLEVFKNNEDKVTFISGNHDWNKGRKDGYAYLLRQETYILNYLKQPLAYLPPHGCLGPVTIQAAPGILLLFLNTQWFVQKGVRPIGETYDCPQHSSDDFFAELDTILAQNQHQKILIAAHHPLYSNALHGGKFTLKQHLFPLTAAHKKVFIPFPVIGSIYPLYRKIFGAHEDMSHPRYRRMRKKLLKILSKYKNLIYAAGHDHNLQYFHLKQNHYIISGSGSKTTFVKKGGKVTFAHEHKGFFIIDFYENETWLRVIEPTPENETSEVFRWKL